MKSILLTGAMGLVAWGVWHTLTQPSAPQRPQPDGPAPKWNGGAAANAAAPQGYVQPSVEMPQDGAGGAPTYPTTSFDATNHLTGSFDAGPPLPDASPPYAKTTPDAAAAKSAGNPWPSGSGRIETDVANSSQPSNTASGSTIERLEAQKVERDFDETMKRVKGLIQQNNYGKALEELSIWLPQRDALSKARAEEMMSYLDRLAGEVVYSPRPYLTPLYTVTASDTPARIAESFVVPWELLAKINRIAGPQNLRNGEKLKVVPGPFHAEINLTKFELTLLLGSKNLYAGRFKIGLGQEVPLAEGEYRVTKKLLNPVYKPDPVNSPMRFIAGGDSLNPLGNKLVDFESPDKSRFGALHGTNEVTSIGGQAKEGCIRLAPDDINDLYDMLLPTESRIRVRR
jgi:lipoprotein-anchoring transpeptidase ErfK/SrfK